jgi:endonuclease-3 related protein
MVGALLTQRTNWRGVQRALEELGRRDLLAPQRLARTSPQTLEPVLRPVGFHRQKAKRLVAMGRAIVERHGGDAQRLLGLPEAELRAELLSWDGVGPETADAIMLYASDKPTMVVDAYTERILHRLGLGPWGGYQDLKAFLERSLPRDLQVFREFHALMDELGKGWCRAKPRCAPCPLLHVCPTGQRTVAVRRDHSVKA